jgi:hypothetical protein
MQEETSNNGHRPEVNQLIRRDTMGGMSISRDSAATQALVAKARADIEARWTMALHRPRNMDQVRALLMKECARPGFADAAIYHKPIGDGIEGLSIRFAEAAARCFGNIAMDVAQIYDDESTRVMRVAATDLETNVTWPQDVTITKTVERRYLRNGQTAVAQRTNSYGDLVYLVSATDDDLLNKQNALVSKALRTAILRIIPGNLQDEAFDKCNAILKDKAAKDPDAARNAVCDGFASLNIQPMDLVEWLGHDLAVATPAEIEQLRRLFVAIRDGEATWPQALEQRAEQLAAKKPKDDKKAKAPSKTDTKGAGSVKEQLKNKQPQPQQAKPDAPKGQQTLPDAHPPTAKDDPEKEPGWMAGKPDERK